MMQFPKHLDLDTVKKAIEGHPEFIIIEKPQYVVVDYVYVDDDSFDDPIRRECRGIKFNHDGTLLARPFHKFRNWGEQPDQDKLRDFTEEHLLLDKLDGSMVHPALLPSPQHPIDRFTLMTRKGESEVAQEAFEILTTPVKLFCLHEMENGFTPIFEYIGSTDHRVILEYPQQELIHLASRNNITGQYHPMTQTMWDVPAITKFPGSIKNIEKFHAYVKSLKGIEGLVIRWASGDMVKIKTDEYTTMHRAADLVNREKDLAKLILEDSLDDFIGSLDDANRERVENFARDLLSRVNQHSQVLELWVDVSRTPDRKLFAERVKVGIDPYLHAAAFKVYDGETAFASIKRLFLSYTINNGKYDELKKHIQIEMEKP
jgi:RNA ligase